MNMMNMMISILISKIEAPCYSCFQSIRCACCVDEMVTVYGAVAKHAKCLHLYVQITVQALNIMNMQHAYTCHTQHDCVHTHDTTTL